MSLVLVALAGCGLDVHNPDAPRRPRGAGPVTFSERYRITLLKIPAALDTDGDGIEDNHLAEGLELLDFAVPDSGFDRVSFNERLAEHVAELRPVHLDVRISDVLEVDVLSSGHVTTLVGTIDETGAFVAGPGDLVLDIVLREGLSSVPLGLLETRTVGALHQRMAGTLYTLVSIDAVVAEVIEPSIPDEGWDVDRDGVPEPRAEVMEIVANLAVLLADTALADGSPAISAALEFEADPSTD